MTEAIKQYLTIFLLFTRRELEVAEALTSSLTTKEIAHLQFRTPSAIRYQMTSVYRKLCLKSRGEFKDWIRDYGKTKRS